MPTYSHLLDEERDQIAIMRAAGRSICAIAMTLQRAKSTVSRELRRKRLAERALFAASRRRSLSIAQAA
jgi:IS30 family transposase